MGKPVSTCSTLERVASRRNYEPVSFKRFVVLLAVPSNGSPSTQPARRSAHDLYRTDLAVPSNGSRPTPPTLSDLRETFNLALQYPRTGRAKRNVEYPPTQQNPTQCLQYPHSGRALRNAWRGHGDYIAIFLAVPSNGSRPTQPLSMKDVLYSE